MTTDHLIFFSVAGLRPQDIDRAKTPTLYEWARRGAMAPLTPSFPCVTSCVQASMWTGVAPEQHGVIANGFYDRNRAEVEFWVARNDVVAGEQIWEALAKRRPGFTSAAWHAQNIKDAAADFIITPAPIHEPDGTMKLWCYARPDGLYQQMLDEGFDHFPLQHYWGPLSNIQSTRWILEGALWLIEKHAPNFHWIYIPHPDYAAQKYGPESDEAGQALVELDRELARFADRVAAGPIGQDAVYVVAGEYALTEVSGVIYPNRILRQADLLAIDTRPPHANAGHEPAESREHEYVNLARSAAFAMVDHQFAHVYVNEAQRPGKDKESICQAVAERFRRTPGIDGVYFGDARRQIGMDHPRAGDVVLVSTDDHWFAYYWWLDDALAPPFARTVDIHRKPGYDAVELFVDPATRSIPLDASLIKASHGVPATAARHRTALICSAPGIIDPTRTYRDTDMKALVLALLGA